MKYRAFKRLVGSIRYRDARFETSSCCHSLKTGRTIDKALVTVRMVRPDRYRRSRSYDFTHSALIDYKSHNRDWCVERLYRLVEAFEIHETKEHFRIGSKRPFDPHRHPRR